jgi:hypothetical protein
MIGHDPLTAEEVLRRCQMPTQEIRWVLTTDDPAIVHMVLELHVERLGEEFAERCSALRELEASLSMASPTSFTEGSCDRSRVLP